MPTVPRIVECTNCDALKEAYERVECTILDLMRNKYANISYNTNLFFSQSLLNRLIRYRRVMYSRLYNPKYPCGNIDAQDIIKLALTHAYKQSNCSMCPECFPPIPVECCTVVVTDAQTYSECCVPTDVVAEIEYAPCCSPVITSAIPVYTQIRLLFNDAGNVPVADPTDVSQWNTYFDIDAYASSPFIAVTGGGTNDITLYGALDLVVPPIISGDPNIIYIQNLTNLNYINAVFIEFEPCELTPINGYRLYVGLNDFPINYRGSYTSSPIIVSVEADAGDTFTGFLQSDCGDGALGFEIPFVIESVVAAEFLRISFDSMANAPVADPTNLDDWNAFFNTSVNADAPFDGAIILGDIIYLRGATNLTITNGLFSGDTHIRSIVDGLGYIVSIGDDAFSGCNNLNLVSFPTCTYIGARAFENDVLLGTIILSSCTNLGGTTGDDNVFQGITGNNITLTIPTALEFDGDVTYLQANNTVTLILV